MDEERELLAICFAQLISLCKYLDDEQIWVLMDKWFVVRDLAEYQIRQLDTKIVWVRQG